MNNQMGFFHLCRETVDCSDSSLNEREYCVQILGKNVDCDITYACNVAALVLSVLALFHFLCGFMGNPQMGWLFACIFSFAAGFFYTGPAVFLASVSGPNHWTPPDANKNFTYYMLWVNGIVSFSIFGLAMYFRPPHEQTADEIEAELHIMSVEGLPKRYGSVKVNNPDEATPGSVEEGLGLRTIAE